MINDNIYFKTIMDVSTSFQLCNFIYKRQVSASRGFESSPLVLGLVNFKGKNSVFVLRNVCDARNVLALLYINNNSVGETIQMVLCIM